LFRRAVDKRDERAWQTVVKIYRGLLISQARRGVVRGLVGDDDDVCVDRAFQRFWVATHGSRKHRFETLSSILQYLRLCLGSVLLDEARDRRRQHCVSINDVALEACISGDPGSQVLDRVAGCELWRAIEAELTDPEELLVARRSFVGGLSPHEILARHPDRFVDITDVYRTKRNLINRLRRSRQIQRVLD
jgi:hypothetical protein